LNLGGISKESSKVLGNNLSEYDFQLSPTIDNLIISPSPPQIKKDESLLWDRVQSLKNFTNIKFFKGDFKDIQTNDICGDTTCNKKEVVDLDIYPSAEIACTRDNIKLINTTMTENKWENSGSHPQMKELVSKQRITHWENEEQNFPHHKEYCNNDPTFSPPLARQLFAKHGLSDIEEIDNDQQFNFVNNQQNLFIEEENRDIIQLSLQKISEAPESHSSNSSSKENYESRESN